MPRRSEGPRLYPRKSFVGADGFRRDAVWIIRDGPIKRSTRIRVVDRAQPPKEARDALRDYLAASHQIPREGNRSAAAVPVADVVNLYLTEKGSKQARPAEVAQRAVALLSWWGDKTLAEVTGRSCRAYATTRGQGAARRELEDLRAAINHHRKEGLCREVVEVWLPERGPSRERWLTRSEAAAIIWSAWRYREVQKGKPTGRRSRRHVARFVLVALYTGTRAGAVCGAALEPTEGAGWIDTASGVFYRRPQGAKETKKRRPPVRLPDRLLAHLRRWKAAGQAFAVEWQGEPVGGIDKAFRHVCDELGLDDVTPHTLRHTAATWLMQRGTDPWEAAGYLGMTLDTLQNVYGHHHPEFQREAAGNIVRKSRETTVSRNDRNEREQTSPNVTKIADRSRKAG